MKVCRFNDNRLGGVIDAEVVDVTTALKDLPSSTWPVPPRDHLIRNFSTLKNGIEAAIPADEIPDPENLDLSLHVNGTQRQSSNINALIFNIPKLIAYASAGYRLYPGDGTPEGVGPVVDGDVVTSKVARLGTMTVRVSSTRRAHEARS